MSIFKTKKIIILSFLILVGIFFHINTTLAADSLSISAETSSSQANKPVKITAETNFSGFSVYFTYDPAITFSASNCALKAKEGVPGKYECNVTATASKDGKYTINAYINKTGVNIPASPITLSFSNKTISVTVKSPVKTGAITQMVFSTTPAEKGVLMRVNVTPKDDKVTLGGTPIGSCTTFDDGTCPISFSSLNTGEYKIGLVVPTGYAHLGGVIKIVVAALLPGETTSNPPSADYYPLATLPGVGEECDPEPNPAPGTEPRIICVETSQGEDGKPGIGFAGYLNVLINLFIGICAVLAMIMIVMGGIQYMTTGMISSKEAAKETIVHAILGLLLALGAFAILNTLNPDLLDVSLNSAQEAKLEAVTGGDYNAPSTFTPISQEVLINAGIECPMSGGVNKIPSIASSFKGKTTYKIPQIGWDENKKTLYQYCSSFVNQVYTCAGLGSSGGGNTASMFSSQNPKAEMLNQSNGGLDATNNKFNGITLSVGDLLGWPSSGTGDNDGHVIMYLGGGKTTEVHGPSIDKDSAALNKAIDNIDRSLKGTYNDRIKYVIRASKVGSTGTSSTKETLTGVTLKIQSNPIKRYFAFTITGLISNKNYTYSIYENGEILKIGGYEMRNLPTDKSNGTLISKDISSVFDQLKGKTLKFFVTSAGKTIDGAVPYTVPN